MKTLLTPHQIRAGVLSITEKLMTRHNSTTPIVMIGVMRGGFVLYSKLISELQNMNIICDFITCSSYDGTTQGNFKLLLDSKVDVKDKHVYIIDDILDSGVTYDFLKIHYEYKEAKSVDGIFLLKKWDEKYKNELCIMSIPKNDDRWYYGCGMNDPQEGSRHLEGIYYL
jgi:hypoxanthine phosphoribosyltransferase